MKKIAFIIITLFSIASCSNDGEDVLLTKYLIGDWAKIQELASNEGLSESLMYSFKSDGTFTIIRTIMDDDTEKVLGYKYNAIGLYSLLSNKLILNNTEVYINNDSKGLYTTLDNLELSNTTFSQEQSIFFSAQKNVLTLDYGPCDDAANCVNNLVLERVN